MGRLMTFPFWVHVMRFHVWRTFFVVFLGFADTFHTSRPHVFTCAPCTSSYSQKYADTCNYTNMCLPSNCCHKIDGKTMVHVTSLELRGFAQSSSNTAQIFTFVAFDMPLSRRTEIKIKHYPVSHCQHPRTRGAKVGAQRIRCSLPRIVPSLYPQLQSHLCDELESTIYTRRPWLTLVPEHSNFPVAK